jgi:hypothetical protein
MFCSENGKGKPGNQQQREDAGRDLDHRENDTAIGSAS